MFTCVGCGGAGVPNRLLGEGCLSGASSLAILFGTEAEEPWRTCSEQDRRGRARANMVLVTFAETKVTRRAGATPRIIIPNPNDNPQHPTLTKMIPSHRNPGSPMKDVGDDKCGGCLWGLRFRTIGFGSGNGGIGAEVLIGFNDAA